MSKWQIKELEEICNFQNGFAFKSKFFKSSGLPVLRISNIQNENLETEDLVFFNPQDYKENFEKYRVEKGDLVIAMSGATTGKLGINNSDTIFYLNQRVGKFLPKENLVKKYLHYFLSTQVEENLRISAGSAQPNLSTEQIKNLEIPLPSISEQKRIVGILDEVFDSVAKVKEATENNLKNAREVFESYLQSVFENSKYEEKRIDEVAKVVNGFSFDSKDFSPKNKVKSVKITNVGVGNFIEEENNFLPESYFDIYFDYQAHEGDIAIALTRTIISDGLKVAIVPKSYDRSLLNQRVAAIRTSKDQISQSFLYNFLRTKKVADYVKSNVNTLMQPNLSINDLKKLLVPCPSSNEQKQIITKLEALSAETKKLEEIYKQKLTHLEELKKSILKKAFNGEL